MVLELDDGIQISRFNVFKNDGGGIVYSVGSYKLEFREIPTKMTKPKEIERDYKKLLTAAKILVYPKRDALFHYLA